MIDWVEVLRRLLALYSVSTQAELGLAMAMPVDVGLDDAIQDSGIPWKILARAVQDRDVDWNWLLTGEGKGPAIRPGDLPSGVESRAPARAFPAPPRLDTRDFARSLLDGDDSVVRAQLDDEIQALGENQP